MTMREAGAVLGGITRQAVHAMLKRGELADLMPETVLALKRARDEAKAGRS